MSKYEEVLEGFKKEMNDLGLSYHEKTYHKIVDNLGPAIYDRDASLVACSDSKEVEYIRKNYLIDKMGFEDSPKLSEAIDEVCHALGQSNRNKHRATFYYLLLAILEKNEVFPGK